jgi:hypothetical protein
MGNKKKMCRKKGKKLVTIVSSLEICFLFFMNKFREGTYPGFLPIAGIKS